jgi:hypothetical protein
MDIDFNRESGLLEIRLSESESLSLIDNQSVHQDIPNYSPGGVLHIKPMLQRIEQFKANLPIGDEQYKRSLGRKSLSVTLQESDIAIVIPRTILASNIYQAIEIPTDEITNIDADEHVNRIRIELPNLSGDYTDVIPWSNLDTGPTE